MVTQRNIRMMGEGYRNPSEDQSSHKYLYPPLKRDLKVIGICASIALGIIGLFRWGSLNYQQESEKPVILETVSEIPGLRNGRIVGQDRGNYLVDINGDDIPDYTITKLEDLK